MGDEQNHKWLYALCAVAFAVILFNQLTRDRSPAYEPQSSDEAIRQYARATLEDLQPRSIANNQEFCGVIYEDADGTLHTSKVYDGERAECAFDWGLPLGNNVVASFHTHGGYDFGYDSEVPSEEDLASDIGARIDGFVSTPGGRLWKIDWQEEMATQICDTPCLQKDPRHEELPGDVIQRSYTLADLQSRMRLVIPPL